jgi:hypothetical protein
MTANRRVCCRAIAIVVAGFAVSSILLWKAATLFNWNPHYRVGQEMDRLNGVAVFFNGGVGHTSGRHLAPDGYNLGLKYQCVEFVKRYYYERLNHKMPDSHGNAKDFFRLGLPDGALNVQRGLLQFAKGSRSPPRPDDLLVFGPSLLNRYGHVAIVSAVSDSAVEIVQQNPGPFRPSREAIPLRLGNGSWELQNKRVLGWLRKPTKAVSRTGASRFARSQSERHCPLASVADLHTW